MFFLIAKNSEIQRSQIGAHLAVTAAAFDSLALNFGLGARLARARRAGRAGDRGRALDIGATRARARRALTALLFAG